MLRRLHVFVLVCALLAAQALGLLHGIAHAPHAAGAPAGSPAQANPQASPEAGSHGIAGLFAGHSDERGCRLYDALGHAGPASLPLLVLPMALAPALALAPPPACIARAGTPFDARGPPHD